MIILLVAGNKNYGLANSLSKLYPTATYASRTTGYDLVTSNGQKNFSKEALNHDIIILCSALHKFNQTVLLNEVYKQCIEFDHYPHIIVVGSTTDRVKSSKIWLYNAEKKALRDYANSMALNGVWNIGPKISLISFGSLSNVQDKHPDRKCIDIDKASLYIKWLIEQPKNLNINEISIDPMQNSIWYD